MDSILVTGAKGQLGRELINCLSSRQTELGPVELFERPYTFTGIDIDELDLTNADAVREYFSQHPFSCIINCAAFTNVNACESQEEAAYQANKVGPENLAKEAQKHGIRLIHISTDYVFDGDGKTPYKETDPPHPVSAYGRTKLAGEQAVEENCSQYAIVRTSWLYGYYGHNFVKTIQKAGREKGVLKVVSDQVGNPTNASDLAYHLLKLVTSPETGIFHGTGRGICSWYDFAKKIIEYSGIDAVVNPCTTEEYPTPAHRPAYSALDHTHMDKAVRYEFRPWQEALKYFVDHEAEHTV